MVCSRVIHFLHTPFHFPKIRLTRTLTTLPLVFVMYFNISGGAWGVVGLALLPAMVLVIVVVLELHDVSHGLPAVLGALLAAALGPIAYLVAVKYRAGVLTG